ncbi:DHS-like NAD/FAD-binding domain-containing protein, partial [Tribonema minus]
MSRSRAQGNSLDKLVQLIQDGKAVTIITGAGLSAASGIPTFRGTSSSVWAITSTAKARRQTLLRDPVKWYNEFWLRYFPENFMNCKPNAGHELAECHGRLGIFKCLQQEQSGGHRCTYAHSRPIKLQRFDAAMQAQLRHDPQKGRPAELTEAPRCPGCGAVAAPMSLLFDEDYDSHSFYRLPDIKSWLDASHALVFVGTSFTVTIT